MCGLLSGLAQGTPVHMFDFQGHGSRGDELIRPESASWDGFAVNDVMAVAKAAIRGNRRPLIGVGHSFG